MSAHAEVCPVVGTTNQTLPPSHPSVDLSKPGQVCPVVGAKTEHHGNLHQHPDVSIPNDAKPGDAQRCPVVSKLVNEPQSQELDDKVCPVVGPVTTILPPDHPKTEGLSEEKECPVTHAKVGHHLGKVATHPSVEGAAKGAVCPVVGHA